jgi:hypothetical protein
MTKDRAHNPKRVPNIEPWDPKAKQLNAVSAESINPSAWEGEPLRHVSVEDMEAAKAHNTSYQEGHKNFDKGEIKTTNERIDSGELPNRYKGK